MNKGLDERRVGIHNTRGGEVSEVVLEEIWAMNVDAAV